MIIVESIFFLSKYIIYMCEYVTVCILKVPEEYKKQGTMPSLKQESWNNFDFLTWRHIEKAYEQFIQLQRWHLFYFSLLNFLFFLLLLLYILSTWKMNLNCVLFFFFIFCTYVFSKHVSWYIYVYYVVFRFISRIAFYVIIWCTNILGMVAHSLEINLMMMKKGDEKRKENI